MSIRRPPLNAFLMSCIVAGWGMVYIGRVTRALRIAGLMYIGLILAGILGLIANPKGIYAILTFIILIKLTSAIASAWLAHKHTAATLPGLRFHVLYLVTLILLTLTLLFPFKPVLLGYQLYHIPSGSMAPTLEVGDYIVSDTRYRKPKVGDIVIYRFDGIEATKRIAAIGGDTLAIVNGNIIVNGQNLGLFFAPANRVKKDYSLDLAPFKVEPNHVYLLGDNRDVSNDSRFIGQVALKDITGKVTGILLSAKSFKSRQ